jgi:outer membrane protein
MHSQKGSRTAFVKNAELFSGFDLTKELNAKLSSVKQQRKAILDSLYLNLKMASTNLELKKEKDEKEMQHFQMQKQEYMSEQKEFDEDTERLTEQYNSQVWKQINQFVSDYGKDFGYEYIYGASGDGNLMYADEKKDITKELIEYINQKYKGDKK